MDWRKDAVKNVINQELMRSTNKKLILEQIQKNAPISKTEVSLKLGLSATSISTFINELLAEELIISCGNAKSTGGRKSILYRVNPKAHFVIGIDLQVDTIIGVLTDFQGETISSKSIPLNGTDEWYVIKTMGELIQSFILEENIPLAKLGIGIGIPGIVQSNSGIVEFAPNLGWKNVNIRQALALPCPVFIENEANAAAIGEKNFGLAREASNLVYISIGTGVGCGLFLNGKLYLGPTHHAGEFGHMIVESQGIPCGCGNKGCWEVYTSNTAMLKGFEKRSGQKLERFEDLLARFAADDPAARDVMEEAVRYLGLGIANIANGLNPEMIVIGGKIAKTRDSLFNLLLKSIKDNCLDKTFSGLTVEFSQMDNLAGALGVTAMVIEKLYEV